MKDECLICGAPLEYLERDTQLECALCGKKEQGKTRCTAGHYVCSACHTAGVDAVFALCLKDSRKDPGAILNTLMDQPFCHMHGPEHQILVGSALLTAYKNAGGKLDLAAALAEMRSRGGSVPGGACGFWGACGAGISAGIFVSIATGATPLAGEPFALAHQKTAQAQGAIGRVGGPRCCKRDSYLSLQQAVEFAAAHLGVQMELAPPVCRYFAQNNQCLGRRCPFSPVNAQNP